MGGSVAANFVASKLTVAGTSVLEASLKVIVLALMVDWSIASLKVTTMLASKLTPVPPWGG